MKINKELWDRFEASNSKKRKKSASLRAVARHVAALRRERAERKGGDDLGRISPALKLEIQRRIAASSADQQAEKDVRDALMAAARVARAEGFKVKASKDRAGRISSYYADRGNGIVRISDHVLPMNAKREAQADFHGGKSPFAGEVIIDGAASKCRLRRLIILAEAGRI